MASVGLGALREAGRGSCFDLGAGLLDRMISNPEFLLAKHPTESLRYLNWKARIAWALISMRGTAVDWANGGRKLDP
jgi:hypothetical protein